MAFFSLIALSCSTHSSTETDTSNSDSDNADIEANSDGDSDSDTDGDSDSDSDGDSDSDSDGDSDSDSDGDSDGGSDEDTDSDADFAKGSECIPIKAAVYTDIDETLTTSNSEWLKYLMNPSYDPAMRLGANTMMQEYAKRGYTIFYITARGEDMPSLSLKSARAATRQWLVKHKFPVEDRSIYLAQGLVSTNAVDYKSGVIIDLEAEGWEST